MVSDAINFAYSQMGVPSDSWKIFYDFQQSGGAIPSISSGQSQYSGIPSTFTTGLFTGQHVRVSNAASLDASSWLMMFVFEKTNNDQGVLFSNYHGELPKSGFSIGVNSANRLYLETFGDSGPDLHEIGIDLGTRNAVAVNKLDNLIELSYYNFNDKTVYTNGFLPSSNSFLPSNDWYLGAAINPPSYCPLDPFHGKMEMYLYMTGVIFPPQRATLFSGLTLAQAPTLEFGNLGESCIYSYIGLTGQISNITFETIETEIFCIQTGFLANQVGSVLGVVSGIVSGGTGVITGFVSGLVTSGSGYTIPHTGYVSGFSGYQEVATGIKIFQHNIPSGTKDVFIPFPTDYLPANPIVFTELEDATLMLTHQITEVTSSGLSISFSDFTASNDYILTTMVAPSQTDLDMKFFKQDIPLSTNNFYVSFPFPNVPNPKIFCQLENPGEEIFPYGIINPTASGFNIQFGATVDFPGVKLHTLVTNLDNGPTFQILQNTLTSGVNSQSITYPTPFTQTPIIFTEMTNISGEGNIILHQVTGASNTNFYAEFSENLPSPNYVFNSLLWSGSYTYATGHQLTYLGQITDTCQNIYNLSGIEDVLILTAFDLPVYKPVNFTGITGSIENLVSGIEVDVFYNVGYTLALNTGQTANFTHQIVYQNDGYNFIRTDHTLTYSGSQVQPTPFTVFKNCYASYGYRLENYIYNSGYIYSFGMDGVHYLEEINDQDLSELYVFPYTHNKTNVDIDSVYNRTVEEFFTYRAYPQNGLNVYMNGLGLLGGGFHTTGDIYNQGIELDFDYVITGNYLLTNGLLDGGDSVVFDGISGQRTYRNVPQDYTNFSGNLFLRYMDTPQTDFYFDGVKLISGVDYTFDMINTIASGLRIINTGLNDVSGIIFSMPRDPDYIAATTGELNYIGMPRFARGTSMLWANGVRQNLDEQYLEVAAIGLLTGSRNFDRGTSLIFNNEGTFWS